MLQTFLMHSAEGKKEEYSFK